MFVPDFTEFAQLAEQGNLVPVYREILADLETPVSAFKKLGEHEHSFLLESVEGGENLARYSFLGVAPKLVLSTKGREVTITRTDTVGRASSPTPERFNLDDGQDPLHVLERLLAEYRFVERPELPRFCGGAVGYLGWDVVRFFEPRIPDTCVDDLNVPDVQMMLTDTLVIFDHVKHNMRIVSNAHVTSDADPRVAYEAAKERIRATIAKLRQPLTHHSPLTTHQPSTGVTYNMGRDKYNAAVAKCKEYIAAGDCIQIVFSQRLQRELTAHPFDLYRALRSVNPSPYMFYLTFGDLKLVGASPEILVTEDRGLVRTRPLAGTRRRGETKEEDEALERELLADEKERAEHVMLVDLGRNDIGRVCKPGTVRVNELMKVERYSHVMHIYSDVTGELDPKYNQFDVLRATFPAGTLSGAPKIRAMEIIDELEPTKRGPYGGALGYFSFSGNMDTAIILRTAVIKGKTAYIQAGGGIVADSEVDAEYQETVNKSMALRRAIDLAEAGLE